MQDNADVRRAIERRLPNLTDDEWAYLEKERYVHEVLDPDDPQTVEGLVRLVRRNRKIFRPPSKAGVKRDEEIGPRREEVQGLNWALEAGCRQDVQDFRDRELGDTLLTGAEIEAWIEGRSEPGTMFLEVAIPADHDLVISENGIAPNPSLTVDSDKPGVGVRRTYLTYATPDEDSVRRVSTAKGSTLDYLRRISERLADDYGWQPAQATIFVLTGLVPIVAPVRLTTRNRSSGVGRVILDVDPAATPADVAKAYGDARRELGLRTRSLSAKRYALAAFAMRHPNEALIDKLLAWNAEAGRASWRYDPADTSHFNRDIKAALEHVRHDPMG